MEDKRELIYKTLLRISPDAICFFDGDGEIIMINDKASELLQRPKEDIIGMSVYTMIASNEHPDVKTIPQEIGFKGFLLNKRFTVIRLDGTSIPVEVNYSSVPGEKGSLKGYLAVFRDISDRVKAEEENLRLEKQLLSIIIKRLSDREIEMIGKIYNGNRWPEKKNAIAEIMNVKPGTLDKFMSRIKAKLETDDTAMILQITARGLGWK